MDHTDSNDKSYHEILENAIALIPTLTNKWTDFNPSDTGIAILEICAAMQEMQRFYVNQIGERFFKNYVKLLFGNKIDWDSMNLSQLLQTINAENKKIFRAVTADDYINIIKNSQVEFTGIFVKIRDDQFNEIQIYLYQNKHGIPQKDLDYIKNYLDDFRLLTTKITINEIKYQPFSLDCTIKLDNMYLHRNIRCKNEILDKIERYILEKPMDQQINIEHIKTMIYGVTGVAEIKKIELVGCSENEKYIACEFLKDKSNIIFDEHQPEGNEVFDT